MAKIKTMDINKIRASAISAIKQSLNERDIESIRIEYLGRKGKITAVLKSLKDLPLEKRREIGPEAQKLKREIENLISQKGLKAQGSRLKAQIDLSAPGTKISRGHLHPLTLVEDEVRRIFKGMNFSLVDGPEIETEHYNFDALNIPANHPAREMWDTFWIKNPKPKTQNPKLLLRTHTSPVQIRYMETHQPPFQIIVPGRVFRYEATDASHEINFYQLEGLMVGKNIALSNFKFVVEEFLKKFFGLDIEFRYRPSYFPFVEPGLEVDIKLKTENSKLKAEKWLEVMGAGMVHPRVFEYAHYNPTDWQGFAFGVGLDRLAMLKYKIPDIRLFYGGDLRFVRQF